MKKIIIVVILLFSIILLNAENSVHSNHTTEITPDTYFNSFEPSKVDTIAISILGGKQFEKEYNPDILENDTINLGFCSGLNHVVITLPKASIKYSIKKCFIEDCYRIYPLGDPSYILLHYGLTYSLDQNMRPELLYPDDILIYECKIGDKAWSRSFLRNNLYFRFDNYYFDDIYTAFENITEENLELATNILSSVKFIAL